eukprot:229300-Amphidinium_carterae.1
MQQIFNKGPSIINVMKDQRMRMHTTTGFSFNDENQDFTQLTPMKYNYTWTLQLRVVRNT